MIFTAQQLNYKKV